MLNDFHSIGKAAQWYVSRLLLPVIPVCSHNHSGMSSGHREKCNCPGKTPVLQGWNSKGHTTVEEVNDWFNRSGQLNLGLVLGQSTHWNLVGIDVDGETGEKLLQEWSQGVIPQTWEFKTAKGRRLLYLLPEGAKSKKFKEANPDAEHQELALLATGQQTVMPPSMHASGHIYHWVTGCSPEDLDIADAPQWVINRVVVHESNPHFKNISGTIDYDSATEPQSDPTTHDDWNKDVTAGGRNNHLARLTGTLIAKKNLPKDQVLVFIKTWNKDHCKPPLDESEIEKMVETIYMSEQLKQAKKIAAKNVLKPTEAAEKFLAHQQELGFHWRFTATRGVFYRADEVKGPWKPMSEEYATMLLSEYLIPLDEAFDSSHKLLEVYKAMKRLITPKEDNGEIDDIFNLGKNADTRYVQLENGMYDWKKGELVPWNHETHSTLQINARWDPTLDKSKEIETWNNVLEQWVPDEKAREFLQEYIGYCLIPTCNFRTAVFLVGGGRNGKSLFLDIITPLFDRHMSVVPLARISERFDTAQLMDSLVNICADVDMGYLPETGDLKALIAGDEMRAEYKFGKVFKFKPVTRYIFSANNLPKTRDKSEGWISRWKFITFPNTFDIDPMFKEQLLSTMCSSVGLTALVEWAMEGLQRLYARGQFSDSDYMRTTAKAYQHENDSVAAFLETALLCVPHTGKDTQIATGPLYNIYKQWSVEVGGKSVGQIEFTKRAVQLGFQKAVRPVKGKSTNVLIGVLLNPEFSDVDLIVEYNMQNAIKQSLG